MKEETIDARELYDKWSKRRNKIIENFRNGKISLKQRAIELTKNESQFLNYRPLPTNIFHLEDVYNENNNELLVIKLILVHDKVDEVNLKPLLKTVEKYIDNCIEIDNEVYLIFLFKLNRKEVNKQIEEESYPVEEILNPETSYYNSMNIPRFFFIMNLTPLKDIFGIDGVPSLKYPYYKINHGIYLALNNGAQFYEVRKKLIQDRLVRPMYYEDLQEVFRSTWEANIARLLNFRNINWEYEKKGFILNSEHLVKKYGYNTYNPDFFLSDNRIIEVKGYWDAHSLMQVSLFKEQYPEYSLYIIDSDMLYSLNKMYENKVPNWHSISVTTSTENIPIVGITIKERVQNSKVLKIGDRIILQRDYNNVYDRNAIKALNENGGMVGYIAKEWASIYSDKIDLGMKYQATVKSIEAKVIYITVTRTNIDEDIAYDFLI
ncbi:MAG: hypothetical protein PWQ70_3014 [Clostridiales bacterium]|nr:hypothetical protein [Clostridiales bacterium]